MVDIFVAKAKSLQSPPLEENSPKTPKNRINFWDHPHMFYAFLENPEGIIFEDLEGDEKLLLLLRRHFNTNIHWVFIAFVLLLIPLLLIPLQKHLEIFSFFELPARFFVIFTIFYYLLVFTYGFVNFISWYFNVSLITNKRVIDITFYDLVYKSVAATKVSLLQDASFIQAGVLRSLFDYGDVFVQTAGTLDNFSFPGVPKPEKVVRILEGLIGKEK